MARTEKEIIEDIIDVIESLRIYVNQDGGDLEYVKYENGIVYIKILGACVGCDFIDYTYNDGVETILKDNIPEVKALKIIE